MRARPGSSGLSPRENRDIPPLDYERVYRLKAAHPQLADRDQRRHRDARSGARASRACRRRDDGARGLPGAVALAGGRSRCCSARPRRIASMKAAVEALYPYIERELARGVRLHAITRHLHRRCSTRCPVRGPIAGIWRRRPSSRTPALQCLQRRSPWCWTGRPDWRTPPRRDVPEPFHPDPALLRTRCSVSRSASLPCSRLRSSSAASITGLLAGLFGVGGGAVIVPVLYEIFRVLGVPEEVRMQLCVGTSLAIIVPTSMRSFLAHRAKGNLPVEIIRRWAPSVIAGIVAGGVIAAFAPSWVFKLAFVVVTSLIAVRMLFGNENWRLRRHAAWPRVDGGLWLHHRASIRR